MGTSEKNRVLVLVPNSAQAANVPRDLIYGCWCAGKRIGGIKFPPLTSVLIATFLRQEGIQADFRDLAGENLPMSVLDDVIRDYSAIIMLTSTMTIGEDSTVLEHLKSINPGLLALVWGSHPTFLPKQTLSRPGIDVAIRGEGEYVIRDVLKCHRDGTDWHGIKGIAYRRNGDVVVNDAAALIDNLDDLPFPDRSLLSPSADYFNPVVKRTPYTTMYTTRGCPGRCTFCTVPGFYGGRVRMRSADNVITELKQVCSLGFKEVFFRDEIFTASKSRFMKIAGWMRENRVDLTWICSARVGTIDEDMMKTMKSSGCHMIRIGVESGSQKILDLSRKGIKLEETEDLMRLAHKYGIDVHAHMMLGMPGETVETIMETINFALRIKPSVVTFGICTPYPGTPLFEEVSLRHPEIADGSACNIEKLHKEGFFNNVFCNVPDEVLGSYVKLAYRKFYSRPSYILKRLLSLRSLSALRREIQAGRQVLSFFMEKKGIART